MYYVALEEWGITPDYINQQWTPEILFVMFRERKENIRRIEEQQEEDRQRMENGDTGPRRKISDVELFRKMKLPNFVA